MIINQEILTAMKQSSSITFLKIDGIMKMSCTVRVKSLNTEIEKKYTIDTNVQSYKFYDENYIYEGRPMKTVIGHLKIGDNISLRVIDRELDDTLTIIEICLEVIRKDKRRIYIIGSSTAKFLYQ